MERETADSEGRGRRDYLRCAGAVVAGGLFAGCTGESGEGSPAGTQPGTTDGSGATDSTEATDGTATDGTENGGGSYSVSMVPVGEVSFESVPKTWVANNGSWADMGVALGQEPPKALYLASRWHTQYYDDIPGVGVDKSGVNDLFGDSGIGKEQFLSYDADVHVMDPNFVMNRGGWKRKDIDQIESEVGPFFGNSIFSRSYPWHEDYRYYTLMEAFEKLSQVFQQRERYEAFEGVHEEFQNALAPVVPGRSERPAVAVLWGSGDEPEKFYPYVIDEGTSFKHLRDLRVKDALANSDVKDFHSSRGAIDYETMLEIDPEVLLVRGQEAKSAEKFQNTVVSFMENHDVASELTAVENGDVYRGGPLYQGPISNLVVTERLARDLYGAEETLFDRQRVGDIVNGNV